MLATSEPYSIRRCLCHRLRVSPNLIEVNIACLSFLVNEKGLENPESGTVQYIARVYSQRQSRCKSLIGFTDLPSNIMSFLWVYVLLVSCRMDHREA